MTWLRKRGRAKDDDHASNDTKGRSFAEVRVLLVTQRGTALNVKDDTGERAKGRPTRRPLSSTKPSRAMASTCTRASPSPPTTTSAVGEHVVDACVDLRARGAVDHGPRDGLYARFVRREGDRPQRLIRALPRRELALLRRGLDHGRGHAGRRSGRDTRRGARGRRGGDVDVGEQAPARGRAAREPGEGREGRDMWVALRGRHDVTKNARGPGPRPWKCIACVSRVCARAGEHSRRGTRNSRERARSTP